MIPLLPLPIVHRILEVEARSSMLCEEVDKWSERTRLVWQKYPGIEIFNIETGAVRSFLIGRSPGSLVTIIPVYAYFASGFHTNNPFNVDWKSIDSRNEEHVIYIASVINALSSQGAIWAADYDTSQCEVLWNFSKFITALDDLFQHLTCVSTLRTYELADVLAPAA